jgi:hypothetical protein
MKDNLFQVHLGTKVESKLLSNTKDRLQSIVLKLTDIKKPVYISRVIRSKFRKWK